MKEIEVAGTVYRLDMSKISFQEYYVFIEASEAKNAQVVAISATRMFRKALGVNQAEKMPLTHFPFALTAFVPLLAEVFGGIAVEKEIDEIVRRKDEEA